MKPASLLRAPQIIARRARPFLTSTNNLSPDDLRRYRRARFLLPRVYRRFFEGAPQVPGQLWAFERRLLFNTVKQRRPKVVCESGTWLGGGSTYFIALALRENNVEESVLHTTESQSDFYGRATGFYRDYLPELEPFVRFHLGKSVDVYPPLLPEIAPVDLLLLDGAEDAQETMNEFRLFLPHLAHDATIIAHDWNTEKMKDLKSFFQNDSQWRIEHQLRPPVSLGMVVVRRAPGSA